MVIDDEFIKKFEMQIEAMKNMQQKVGKAIEDAQKQVEKLREAKGQSVEDVLK
ncbi:MAG: hypothetical protein AAAB35_26265 [Phyllobacterium sp.]|uniref:hypothetical protein n=1 Tax=Phyllobacterium TaxID=28100 RepID=UPI0014750C3F|nr:hypothetical protein [Phyllobacterium sophorae]